MCITGRQHAFRKIFSVRDGNMIYRTEACFCGERRDRNRQLKSK